MAPSATPSARSRRRMRAGRVSQRIGPNRRSPRRTCTAANPPRARPSAAITGRASASTRADGRTSMRTAPTTPAAPGTSRRQTGLRTRRSAQPAPAGTGSPAPTRTGGPASIAPRASGNGPARPAASTSTLPSRSK